MKKFIIALLLIAVFVGCTNDGQIDETIGNSKNNTDYVVESESKTVEVQGIGNDEKRSGEENLDKSDWKTYTNEKYNFSFQYPPNASVKLSTGELITTNKGEIITINLENGENFSIKLPDYKAVSGGAPGKTDVTSFLVNDKKVKRIYKWSTQGVYDYDSKSSWNLEYIVENDDVSLGYAPGWGERVVQYKNGFTEENRYKDMEDIMESIIFDITASNFTLPKIVEFEKTTLDESYTIRFNYQRKDGFDCHNIPGMINYSNNPKTRIVTECYLNNQKVFAVYELDSNLENLLDNPNITDPVEDAFKEMIIAGKIGRGVMLLNDGKNSYNLLVPMNQDKILRFDFGENEKGYFVERDEIQTILDSLNIIER